MKLIKQFISIKLLFFLLVVVVMSCKDKNSVIKEEESEVLCDLVWTSIALRISNQHGEPVRLDDYYTIKTSTGDKISLKTFAGDSILKASGRYLILSDSQKNMTVQDGVNFEFYGFKNGQEVVRKTYKIGHDRCHVQLISGPSTLTIEE